MELLGWAVLASTLAISSYVLLMFDIQADRYRLVSELPDDCWTEERCTSYPVTLDNVLLVPEDTTHYQIYAADGEEEWKSQFPTGGGFVKLGPQNRTFQVTMFYELQCLGHIRNAIATQSIEDTILLQECFNFLREMVLCRADVTLEDILDEQHSVNHMFAHVCRDWETVYTEVEKNYKQHF